ncbi:MAG: hypothetical protein JXB14_02740, partial [Candidatus Altiarchaeota archaeon]|nr:hypothetical protein [Candidatus Altiarchaeota archaeon]
VRQMARIIKQNLEPGRRVYIEYANEVWNYPQHYNYARGRGYEMGFTGEAAAQAWYGRRAAEIFKIFREEGFTDGQLATVVASQGGWPDRGKGYLKAYFDWVNAHPSPYNAKLDYYAIGYYFGADDNVAETDTVDQVLDNVEANLENHFRSNLGTNQQNAKSYGVRLIAYESGPGSGQEGWGTLEQNINAHRHPRMKEVYKKAYAIWKEMTNSSVMNVFVLSGVASRYGYWGHLEYIGQKPYVTDVDNSRPYKYEAVLEITKAYVGDGKIEEWEECDDGNKANGDGCSSDGKMEDGYGCRGEPSVCGMCALTSASWSVSQASENQLVSLSAGSNGFCEGKNVHFSVYWEDGSPLDLEVAGSMVKGDYAVLDWRAQGSLDGTLASYSFTAGVDGGNTVTSGLMQVSPDLVPPQIQYIGATPSNNSIVAGLTVEASINEPTYAYAFTNLDKSLAAWYRLDQDLNDWSGNVNNGVAVGGGKFVRGKFGGARAFENDHRIDVTNPTFQLGPGITISAWVRPMQGSSYFISQRTSGGYTIRLYVRGSNDFAVDIQGASSGGIVNTAPDIAYGRWYHVLASFSQTEASLYVNGELMGMRTMPPAGITGGSTPFRIGSPEWSSNSFNGSIDEVFVFHSILSAEERQALLEVTSPYRWDYTLADGDHSIKTYAVDGAGNMASTGERRFRIDSTTSGCTQDSQCPSTGCYVGICRLGRCLSADLNGNGVVDLADILVIISNWATTEPSVDLDGSGTANLGDVIKVIAVWAFTC